MARTALTVQVIARTGLDPAYSSANADGHSVQNTGRECVHVVNGGGGAITVTIQTPGTVDGLAVSDRTVSVPAGEDRIIGPFPVRDYNQPNTETIYVDFSGVTSVTVAALRL